MSENHSKMIIVAYFHEEDLDNKFHHIHIIPSRKSKRCNTNLYIEVDFTNEAMQVFTELSRLKRLENGKNKVMKFKEKNINFIDLTKTKKIDFPNVEELEIFFPSVTDNYEFDRERVIKKLENIFKRE